MNQKKEIHFKSNQSVIEKRKQWVVLIGIIFVSMLFGFFVGGIYVGQIYHSIVVIHNV